MFAHFKAIQTVDLTVQEQPVPIQHYLRQPHRVIQALVDSKRIEHLGADVFRLKMRPLNFMMVSIQPTVDMRVWAQLDGSIRLESVSCKIQGVSFIDQRFHLELEGVLSPNLINGKTHLVGCANLHVDVDVPPPLGFTPRVLIETTGNKLLSSVLLTIKQRLMHQLLADYRKWAIAQCENVQCTPDASLLSPQRSSL